MLKGQHSSHSASTSVHTTITSVSVLQRLQNIPPPVVEALNIRSLDHAVQGP